MSIWVNAGCGTHLAPKPWVNTDTVMKPEYNTTPDLIVKEDDPFPFDDDSVDRIMLSHVLEHVPWEHVPFFLTEVRRAIKPDGEVLCVGPDAYKIIKSWSAGNEPWEILTSVLEHRDWPPDMLEWPGAPHHWNCHDERVRAALSRSGFTYEVPDVNLMRGNSWPVVGWNPNWQFALLARKA